MGRHPTASNSSIFLPGYPFLAVKQGGEEGEGKVYATH